MSTRRMLETHPNPVPVSRVRPRHDHADFNSLIKDLQQKLAEGSPSKIYDIANRLYKKIAKHIAEEDSPEGLYGAMERIAPQFDLRLRKLRQEHRDILSNLALICAESDDDLEFVRPLVDECVKLIFHHEKEEEKMISDAYYIEEEAID